MNIISEKIIDLDGGQTRMEAAYGSDDGDEDLFAITAKREASVGTIFEQNYRPWDGDFGPRWVRNYAIFRHHVFGLFTSKGHQKPTSAQKPRRETASQSTRRSKLPKPQTAWMHFLEQLK